MSTLPLEFGYYFHKLNMMHLNKVLICSRFLQSKGVKYFMRKKPLDMLDIHFV